MLKKYNINEIEKIIFEVKPWDIIFLHWDLAAWKTTLSKHIINNLLKINDEVKSPTYTYYNKYAENIYHFDLYRLKEYDEFFAIWWEDILDNNKNISIIEWPEVISKYYKPTIEIFLEKTDNEFERIIKINKSWI